MSALPREYGSEYHFLFTSTNPWATAVERSLPHSAWYHLSAEQFAGSMNGRVPATFGGAWIVYAVWALCAAAVAILAVNRRDV